MKQWLNDKDWRYNKFSIKSSSTHFLRTTKKIILKKIIVILPSICQNQTKKFQMKLLTVILVTSRFVQLQNKVSAFMEPVVRGFVVGAAVFHAVLLFFFASF